MAAKVAVEVRGGGAAGGTAAAVFGVGRRSAVSRRVGGGNAVEDGTLAEPASSALAEYIAGRRTGLRCCFSSQATGTQWRRPLPPAAAGGVHRRRSGS